MDKRKITTTTTEEKYRRLTSVCVYCHNLIFYMLGEKKYMDIGIVKVWPQVAQP